MTFGYRQEPLPPPLAALTGRATKGRPLITVSLVGPSKTVPFAGLLDSGADYTIFPDGMAANLGLDLSQATSVVCRGVGGGTLLARFLPVTIRASDGVESREWSGIVGFAALASRHALLGHLGFLEFFASNFHGDREMVELTINSRYNGT